MVCASVFFLSFSVLFFSGVKKCFAGVGKVRGYVEFILSTRASVIISISFYRLLLAIFCYTYFP